MTLRRFLKRQPNNPLGLLLFASALGCTSCNTSTSNPLAESGPADTADLGAPVDSATRDSAMLDTTILADDADAADVFVDEAQLADPFFKGTWVGPPGDRLTFVSATPEIAAPPLKWEPCGPGCQRLVPDWSPKAGLYRFMGKAGAPALLFRSGVPYLHHWRARVGDVMPKYAVQLHVLSRVSDGAVVAATRNVGDGATLTLGSAGVAYWGNVGGEIHVHALSADLSRPTKWTLCDRLCTGGVIRDIHVTERHSVLETYPPAGTTAFDFATLARKRYDLPLQIVVQSADEHGLVGIDLTNLPLTGVGYQDLETGVGVRLVEPEKGRGVYGAVVDPSTNTLVWVETDPDRVFGPTADPKLFVSPFSKTPGGIKRRYLTSWIEGVDYTGFTGLMVAYKGFVASTAAGNDLRIVRLTDGATWIVKPPVPAVAFRRPLYVDDTEVWVEIDEGGYKGPSSAVRIAKSLWGEPVLGK